MPQRFPLLFVTDRSTTEQYTSSGQGAKNRLPTRDRATHGNKIKNELTELWREFNVIVDERRVESKSVRNGLYLNFYSTPGFELMLKSLESLNKRIRLCNVKITMDDEGEELTTATVFVPYGEQDFFLGRVRAYLQENTRTDNPRHKNLIESIERVALSTLESFWSDRPELLPDDSPLWCEIWVRQEGRDLRPRKSLFKYCNDYDIEYSDEEIKFPERNIYRIKANRTQLIDLFLSYDYLAELRLAREPVGFWEQLTNLEQTEWVENLKDRLELSDTAITRILILDTGVNQGHKLLNKLLLDSDMHTYNTEWGSNDHEGHGTLMSGVCAFGDLHEALQHDDIISIGYKLESGKILPPRGQNEPRLYGHITSQVISRAEIANPSAKRIICMAVTVEDDANGRPSSWSGAIDAVAAGYEETDMQRLIVVSAGNVQDSRYWHRYPDTNRESSVHTPAQAWNALTVGAYTERATVDDQTYSEYKPIAPIGSLSPFSTTSITWDKKWPIKPDIVMEGGNAGTNSDNFNTTIPDLNVLSISHQVTREQFSYFNATSAATAKAAHLCATIQAQYPDAWPQTVRGLVVHSAEWTTAMKQYFCNGSTDRKAYENLIRCCGYGVPSKDKALYCLSNVLTLISQETIQPFQKTSSGSYSTKDIHYYELPWPTQVLEALGSYECTLRVTLSYFVEPGPGEVGWKNRYRYASHGLRFDVNNYEESIDNFRLRTNKAARSDNDEYDAKNNSGRWLLGSNIRHKGSIHSDQITAPAAQLAACKYVAVYPAIGWWRERSHLQRFDSQSNYSLIVTLETEATNVDLYTEVANQIGVEITLL